MTRSSLFARSLPDVSRLFLLLLLSASLFVGCNTSADGRPVSSPPLKGTTKLFTPPLSGSNIRAIAIGSDKNVWFSEVIGTSNGPMSKIVRITSAGVMTEFPSQGLPVNIGSLTIGPDNNLWFTGGGFDQGGEVGYITSAGHIKEFPLPKSTTDPYSITTGPDGNLWFTDGNPSQVSTIERITPTGTIKTFSLSPSISPRSITTGPDGNLWFTSAISGTKSANTPPASPFIARFTTAGILTTYSVPSASSIGNIIAASDHNLWFTEDISSNDPGFDTYKLARITPTGTITTFALLSGSSDGVMGLVPGISTGNNGTLWYTNPAANTIGRSTTSTTGSISEFALSNPQSGPQYIVQNPDGTVWFTLQGSNGATGQIERLTPT